MKLPGMRKKEEKPTGCPTCPSAGGKPPFQLQEMMDKKMKEMEKNKVKPLPCPYIKTCPAKILTTDFEILCKDQEKGSMDLQLIHMKGKHLWEMCKDYYKNKTDIEGKTPKEHQDAEK